MEAAKHYYDLIKNDPETWELIEQFYPSQWKKLKISEKKDLFYQLENNLSGLLDEEELIVLEFEDNNPEYLGSYTDGTLYLNSNGLRNMSSYDLLFTYFHERRHKLQYDVVINKNDSNIEVDPNLEKQWRRNYLHDQYLRISNYIGATSDEPLLYFFQPVEIDANLFGFELMQLIIKDLEKKYDSSIETNRFLYSQSKTNPIFFTKGLKQYSDKVNEYWLKQEQVIHSCKNKLFEYVNSIDYLDQMSKDEFYYYFNDYIWLNLDNKQRFKVLSELNNRELIYHGKEGLDLRLLKQDYSIEEGRNTPPVIALCNFFEKAALSEFQFALGHSGGQLSQLLNEVSINLYVDKNGKHINILKKEDGTLKHLIQPFNKFKNDYIYKNLIEFYPYGVANLAKPGKTYENKEAWDYYIKYFDNDELIKKVNIIHGDYYKLYDDLVEEMVDRIYPLDRKR